MRRSARRSRRARPGRVEQAQLEIRRRREAQQQLVFARGVQVVDQQADAHAAQRGVTKSAQKAAAGGVVDDLVVLDVQRDFGAAHELQARGKRVVARRQKAKAGQFDFGPCGEGDPAEISALARDDRARWRHRRGLGQGRAGGHDRDREQRGHQADEAAYLGHGHGAKPCGVSRQDDIARLGLICGELPSEAP